MKKKNINSENYLERIPMRKEGLNWHKDEEGMVVLEIYNAGFMNTLAQKLLKKPKISYIHLDKMGTFLWPLLDGNKDLLSLGKLVDEKFGEEAYPLYERLATYFKTMDSYKFIEWK